MKLEPIYKKIYTAGGITWGKTDYTKDYGLSWCDSRCAFSPYLTGTMYDTDKCSESYAGELWFAVWNDLKIQADMVKSGLYKPGVEAEHWATQMPNCGYGGGNTNQGTGIDAAIDEMLTNGKSGSLRHIALVSDGAPTDPLGVSPVTGTPWTKLYGKASTLSYSPKVWGEVQADDAWDNHSISISVLSFNNATSVSAAAIQSAYMKSLVRGHGDFYETPTAAHMVTMMEEIANNMEVVLVQ
jgi:hypothetical protein